MRRISLILASTVLAFASASPAQTSSRLTATTPGVALADPLFREPYIDIDEWRNAPVRHRYVHGGFRGTDTRFSFYLPPAGQYHGRFFQHITPVPDNENLAQGPFTGEENKIGFAIASGGYFVETNGGGSNNTAGPTTRVDPTIGAFRANAATAEYSRVVAMRMYGGRRPFGYAFGGSGGAYRTVGSAEHSDAWDGVVPYVLGSPMAPPNMFTIRLRAMRILHDKLDRIVDAVEPGGSGDPFTGLTPQEASVLRETMAMGMPIPSLFGWRTMGIHGFAALYGGMLLADPSYFTDFWSRPGYLGHDDPHAFDGPRLQFDSRVATPITALEAARLGLNTSIVVGHAAGGVDNAFAALQGEAGRRVAAFRLTGTPPSMYFLGGDLIVTSGAAAGQRLTIARIAGDTVILGVVDPSVAARLTAGDQVRVDNSNFLAAETYHWHQVPPRDAGYPEWDQFRRADGTPLYPQRPFLLGPLFTAATTGAAMGSPPITGRFHGKMIVVESLWDREAMPWQGDWYRQQVQRVFGGDADNRFRIYMTDHALHGDTSVQEDPTRTVSYLGDLEQALRDLSRWVEDGVTPPASTSYRVVNGQVIVPEAATARQGIQPVASVRANGGARAQVRPGQAVRFTATADVPTGTGRIVAAEWDFDGSGRFNNHARVIPAAHVTFATAHSFTRPGTYFPALRVYSQREGDTRTPYARPQDLGRVRVVVR